MKKIIARLKAKYPFLKWATNRFILVTLFFVTWLLFFDTYAFIDHKAINEEIEKLEKNRDYYKDEIIKDEQAIKKLHRMEEVEKYAREKYYMKRENEDIYIIDIENENASESDSKK